SDNTGRPSLLPVNQTQPIPFVHVADVVQNVTPGTMTLNIVDTTSSATNVTLGTYRVPDTSLSDGLPILHNAGDQPKSFAGAPVVGPLTRQPMSYAGGEPVLGIFTGMRMMDPLRV